MICFGISNLFRRRKYTWSRRDQILLLEQLEMYISAGLAPIRCINIISITIKKRRQNKRKDSSLENISKIIESGGLLSRALSDNIGLSRSLASIIEHGEKIGGLSVALKSTHDLLVKEDELIKRCLSAMTYPVIIGVLAIVLTIGLMRWVVPQIIPMLVGMKVELPFITQITIWLSGAIISYGIYFLIMIIVKVLVTIFLYKKFLIFKNISHHAIWYFPLVGNLVYLYSLSIFLRSFGTLVSSGIPIDVAYLEVVDTISFLPLKSVFISGDRKISAGLPLQDIFSHEDIPVYVASLISAGSASGSLGESLIRSACIIDVDIENTLKRMTSLIEPLMMVGVGGTVGAIALSIMMPIYSMSKVLQHVH